MSTYKAFVGNRGGLRYMKDKRFIAKGKIPTDLLIEVNANVGKDVYDAASKLLFGIKECLFCGIGCKMTRSVNGEIVYMCDQHYYDTNIGQIAQKIREVTGDLKNEDKAAGSGNSESVGAEVNDGKLQED